MSKVTSGETETGSPAYEAPKVMVVGSFAADTLGDVSVGQSDDSDAGQYYAPLFAPTSRS